MQKISLRAVIRGGAAAAITFAVVEFLLEGAVAMLGVKEADLFREAYPDLIVGGLAYHAWNVVQLFLLFFLVTWIYAAIRRGFGPGLNSALLTSIFLWLMYFLFATNLVNLGIFPLNVAITSLVFNLIEIPFAVLVGTRVYDASAVAD
jgi:hypothetical protein